MNKYAFHVHAWIDLGEMPVRYAGFVWWRWECKCGARLGEAVNHQGNFF